MKLFQNQFSPNAKRVRIVAAELGIPFDRVELEFGPSGTRSAEYLAKNPMGKVPTVEVEGKLLWESPAIVAYLAARHPEKKLLPTEPFAFADTLRWMFWNASQLEPALHIIVAERIIKPMMMKQPSNEERVSEAMKDVERFAPVLNGQLEGKPWLMGEQFTIADIVVGTAVEVAAMAGVDWARFPHIKAWFDRVAARPSWKA